MINLWQFILALVGGGIFGTGVAWTSMMTDRPRQAIAVAMLVCGCLFIAIGLTPGLKMST